MINVTISLTPLSRMKLSTFIKWTSTFSSSGMLGVVFHQIDQYIIVFRDVGCCFSSNGPVHFRHQGCWVLFFIKWTSTFSSSWMLGVVFLSYSNFNRASCQQTVENLIRHCSLWRLILACTICLYTFVVYVTHICCIVFSSNWIIIGYRAVLAI